MISEWAQTIAIAGSLMVGDATQEREAEQESRPIVDLRADLHGRQIHVWDDQRRFIPILTSRRAGKSECVIRKVCDITSRSPDTVNPYISITRKHAKINFWKLFKRIALRLNPDVKVNESELTIDFPGGGMVWLGGADKISELEKYRASKCAVAVVDECGVFPSENLQYVVEEVIEPSLLDCDGVLYLSGTPGKLPVAGQYWYDLTGPESTSGFHHWTVFENPFVPNAAERLARLRERRGWTEKTPKYIREYLGRWCDDPDSLVLRFTESHVVDGLPTVNGLGRKIDPDNWRFVIAADVGVVDETAVSVEAAHPDVLDEFIVLVEKHRGWLPSQLGARIAAIRSNDGGVVPDYLAGPLSRAPIVIDTGGMGKVHAEELTRHWLMTVEPAQKTDRESAIEIQRDKVSSCRTKLLRGRCQPLIDECAVLGFDEAALKKGKRLTDPNGVDHAFDSVLYGCRRLRTYVHEERAPEPVLGSLDWQRQEAERMRSRAIAQARQRREAHDEWTM